jgi:hypothetical protein
MPRFLVGAAALIVAASILATQPGLVGDKPINLPMAAGNSRS